MSVDDLGLRFVVDENLARLGAAITLLRRDTGCFGRAQLSELLPLGIGDTEWIPIVAERGWVTITNDKRLRTRPAEATLAAEHGLRVIHLHGSAGFSTPWNQLVRLATRWDAIERALAKAEGAVWLSAQESALRVLRFEPGRPERA